MDDNHSLSHSNWNCKYHIVFVPKYRWNVIYGLIKENIEKILRQVTSTNQVALFCSRRAQER